MTSANDCVNGVCINGNWSYGYDAFNRLATAQTPPTNPTLAYSYSYDRFGNRWSQVVTVGSGWQMPLSFNSNNQISTSGYRYDAAGNVMMDIANCYSYDGENRLSSVAPETFPGSGVCGATTMSYLYDPAGRRVAKLQNGAIQKEYFYDAGGHMLTEANGSGSTLRAEFYTGDRHLATWASGATYYNHSDWLGTERARSDSSGNRCETIVGLPFGDGQTTAGRCSPTPTFFTGKQRDTESGNDYFGARYYTSSAGRFMVPDWSDKPTAVPYAEFGDPQTLNLYDYVRNNPISHADADGHCWPVCGAMFDLMSWATVGVATQGAKPFAKNVAIGAAKGAGQFVYNSVVSSFPPAMLAKSVGLLSTPKLLQPSNVTQAQSAFVTNVGLGVATAVATLGLGSAAGTSDASAMVTVTHFTNDAGVTAITEAGGVLRGGGALEGTYVVPTSEVPPGATSSRIESLLEVGPGKGANSITFQTPKSNLAIPANGPSASGALTQFRLNDPTKIDPAQFLATDPDQ